MIIAPAFYLILTGFLIAISARAPEIQRKSLYLIGPLVTLVAIWQIGDGVLMTVPFLGYELELVEGSKIRRLFATIFAIAAFGGGLFALNQAKWQEVAAAFLYAAGAIGVCFAGDFITFFLFWEMMAIFSTLIIWLGGSEAAKQAGLRYAALHFLGGVILKIGLIGLAVSNGSIDMTAITLDNAFSWCVFLGVLVNAGAPLVNAWVADAYPEASPTGSVFLSAFTTKTAV